MRKQHTDYRSRDENVFAMSTGDLMASLLFIFILLLTGALLQVRDKSAEDEKTIQKIQTELVEAERKSEQDEETIKEYKLKLDEAEKISEQKERKAKEYQNIKAQLYDELYEEFKDKLEEWHASIDRETLSFRFKEPETLFDKGASDIKLRYKKILDDFFPKYISVLLRKNHICSDPYLCSNKDQYKFKDHIVEIRIEGHTDSDWLIDDSCPALSSGAPSRNCGYYKNMQLSQERARNVLIYCMDMMQNQEENGWLIKVFTANGMSYSHLICPEGKAECQAGEEDKQSSRRVEFRVRTDAEEQLESIAESESWVKNSGKYPVLPPQ